MARIRSVKPEFFTSETIATLSVSARLTFIGLWTYADDYGRAQDNPKLLKAAVWPLDDDVSAGQVAGHLDEFQRAGRICRYSIEGKRYLHIVTWDEHQKPKNPSEPKYPACPKQDHGGDGPGEELPQPYPSPTPEQGENGATPSLPRARARSREQGTGSREGVKPIVEHAAADAAPARPVGVHPETVKLVFETWRKAAGKPKARLDNKRTTRIVQALKHYPLEDVLDAVKGWRNSPHHCGSNDRGTVYNDLELLLRDAKHIEGFRDLQRDGPSAAPMGRQTQQMVATHQALTAWAAEEVNGNGSKPVAGNRRAAQRELARPADRTADSG